jgi:hypothetical protein
VLTNQAANHRSTAPFNCCTWLARLTSTGRWNAPYSCWLQSISSPFLPSGSMAATTCICPPAHSFLIEHLWAKCRLNWSLIIFPTQFTFDFQCYSIETPSRLFPVTPATSICQSRPHPRLIQEVMPSRQIRAATAKDILRYRAHHGVNLGGIFVLDRRLFPNMFDCSVAGNSEHDAVIS